MTAFPRPRIVLSKCIGFAPCRYDGAILQDKFITRLEAYVQFVCVCPEVEIGLGTPRAPLRIIAEGKSLKLMQPSSDLNFSGKMSEFSGRFLGKLEEVDGFILKNRSPSCGFTDVKIYSGPEKGGSIGRAAGFFGGAVLEKFGDRALEDEGRLKNQNIREHFLTRIFASARFRRLRHDASMHALVRFHADNKPLLMCYSQTKMRELGRIVANGDGKQIAAVWEHYGKSFREAFHEPPKHTALINVLMHMLGYFKKWLSVREKGHFLEILDAYRDRKMHLSSAVCVLRSWLVRFEPEYLCRQTFFNPFPDDLLGIDDSSRGRV